MEKQISSLVQLQAAALRFEALVKVVQENLIVVQENLLAAAVELRKPIIEERKPICMNCGKDLEDWTSYCSKDCAEEHETHVKVSMATGN